VPETKSFLSSGFFGGPNVAATVDLGRLCSVPKNKFFLSWGSLGAPNVTARTMLNTDSFVLDLIGAPNVAADILLRTMLNSGYVVLNGLVASLVAAVFHYPLQEFIHITTHRCTVHHQLLFTEIIMPKSCIKNRNLLYVHSIWTSDLVSKSGQTLLI
jgi:hypothetical protein